MVLSFKNWCQRGSRELFSKGDRRFSMEAVVSGHLFSSLPRSARARRGAGLRAGGPLGAAALGAAAGLRGGRLRGAPGVRGWAPRATERSGAEDWNLRDALRLCELLRAQVPWAEPGAAAELLLLPRLRRAEDRRRAREVIRRRAT